MLLISKSPLPNVPLPFKKIEFLGHIVTATTVEPSPDKIQAILDMAPPKNLREAQRLAGRVNALGRFISRAGEKCGPFFKALRKTPAGFEWTKECQEAFDQLKTFLTTPPILSCPQTNEILRLYLAVSDTAVSSALIREDEGTQRPIYYFSKILRDAETRYTMIEKLAFALLLTSRRLRPYFQAHEVVIMTNQPLGQLWASLESREDWQNGQ